MVSGRMTGSRRSFNPSVFANAIYLCGGNGNLSIDKFTPTTGIVPTPFQILQTVHPVIYPACYSCLTYVRAGELVIITRNSISILTQSGHFTSRRRPNVTREDAYSYSLTTPTVWELADTCVVMFAQKKEVCWFEVNEENDITRWP